MKLDGYIRVSRVGKRAGESFISPQVQRERCEGVAQAGGHEIINWVEDLDESGGKADRPGFQRVLTRIEAGETEGMVVAKLDRFARSVADAANALRRIEAAGGALMVAESSLDTSSSFGRFAMHMMLAMAELELDRIRESWDVARGSAVARGVHVASKTPTGYERGGDRRLRPNQDAAAITELFRRRAAGASWSELAAFLEEAEVRTPYGSAFWTTGSVSGVLANRVYLGEARSGTHVLPGAHEALVDERTWNLAQRAKQRYSPPKGEVLLSGLLRCAGCRYVMKPDRQKARSGEVLRMYRCRGKRAAGVCASPASVLAHLIEPYVVDRFMERAGSAEVEAARVTAGVAEAEQRVDEIRAERDAFIEADVGGVLGPERYRQELERRTGLLKDAEADLAQRIAQAGGADLPNAVELKQVWPDLEIDERRQLLSLGIDAVFLRRSPRQWLSALEDRTLVLWRGEGPDDLPRRGRRIDVIRPFDW